MELPHDEGHSRDRGHTERLPAVVLDGKVEEYIGGGETLFWDELATEQGLVIESLGAASREINLCGSSGGGGAARKVDLNPCLLVGIDFLGAMVVDRWAEI